MEWRRFVTYLWNDPLIYALHMQHEALHLYDSCWYLDIRCDTVLLPQELNHICSVFIS